MPLLKKRFKADEVVVLSQGLATDAPIRGWVAPKGTRLRGDHPIVKTYPQFFIEDGVPESEWPSIYDGLGDVETDDAPVAEVLGDIPAARPVATRDAFVQLEGGSKWHVTAGTIHDANNPIVARARKANRGLFAKA